MRGVGNRHLQTMLPRLIRRKLRFTRTGSALSCRTAILSIWLEKTRTGRAISRASSFHGTEGSLHSPYAHGLIHAAMQRGWLGVVMHFRGCSGEPNRNHRIYHSGETEDGFGFALAEASLVPRRPRPSAIRWAAICWAACWQRKATAARWMRR
ncbi:hypothetical protein J4734_01185 [Klebsiella pneumoniae]|uniref:Uncharacterized protein n=1 Tax=Klebsiella pneumoniae TaxID=573 RepID=A0A939NT27_KLEPN|nr:hypothetical protein [Klebsiella pneumoniae]